MSRTNRAILVVGVCVMLTLQLVLGLPVKNRTGRLNKNPLALLVSFDGFRWDYLSMYKENLTNFNRLKQMGSHADYINNSFSTITFPNHWTLVTGLYEESHGIVQNHMFDPILNQTFTYTNPASQTLDWFGQNRQAEPVWATNQRAGGGRLSAAEWIGSNLIFNDQKVLNIPYNRSTPHKDLVDRFVEFFTDSEKPVNFGALYFDEPDHTGHMYGPYSQEIRAKLAELDNLLGYMLDQFESHGLSDRLNLVITSDHGMEQFSSNTTIYLDSHIDTELFNSYGSRACYVLFVKKQLDLDYVYKTLKTVKHIDVYKRDEIPDDLKYKHNVRLGDIIIVTHIGYALYINNQTVDWKINNGDHGYYNNESSMHPFFMANGPAFRQGFKIQPFNNVDVYPLLCWILGIEPAVHNGSLANVMDMLVPRNYYFFAPDYEIVYLTMFLVPIALVAISVILLLILNATRGEMRRQKQLQHNYRDECLKEQHTPGTYFTSLVDSKTPMFPSDETAK